MKETKCAPPGRVKNVESSGPIMAAVNQYTLAPLKADEVYVHEAIVANSLVDRDHERFPKVVLQAFAATLPGKSLLVGHAHEGAPIGKWFAASVREVAGHSDLVGQFYLVKSPQSEALHVQILGGVLHYVSIGFNAAGPECSICEQHIRGINCPHTAGKRYDNEIAIGEWDIPAECYEASIVYLGSQHGAVITNGYAGGQAKMPPAFDPAHYQCGPADRVVGFDAAEYAVGAEDAEAQRDSSTPCGQPAESEKPPIGEVDPDLYRVGTQQKVEAHNGDDKAD